MKKSERQAVYQKYSGRCAYCGDEIEYNAMQVDHIKPKEYGGADHFDNYNPSCRACNNFKNVWKVEEFRRELQEQVKRAKRYSVNFRMAEKYGLIAVIDEPIIFYFERVV